MKYSTFAEAIVYSKKEANKRFNYITKVNFHLEIKYNDKLIFETVQMHEYSYKINCKKRRNSRSNRDGCGKNR